MNTETTCRKCLKALDQGERLCQKHLKKFNKKNLEECNFPLYHSVDDDFKNNKQNCEVKCQKEWRLDDQEGGCVNHQGF